MKNIIKKYISPVLICSVVLIVGASCTKDKYYIDGGTANPKFNGTVLQYLQSNPKFDTIAQIVKIAGLEDVFNKEDITFFAPTDEVIRRDIGQVNSKISATANKLNQQLFNANKDTIKTLADIPPAIWKKYLLRYVVKGKFLLKDYPQLDFSLRSLYPGGYYYLYNNDLANIGVVFNTANNVRYAGYRQLCIASISDPSNPGIYYTAAVATSDVQPTNGVVHVLAVYIGSGIGGVSVDEIGSNRFGMSFQFDNEVLLTK